jgi:phytoene synthase
MTLDISLRQRAIPDGSMRYFAWLYTPAEHRDAIAALFLLESELRDTARVPHDVAHVRLQWWRDEIERLNNGKAQHPATQTLQAAHKSKPDYSPLERLVLCCAQDIAHSTYESDAELRQYFGNYGSLAAAGASMLNDSRSTQVLEAAQKLGAFIREVETLRDLKTDVHRGYLYLPLNELDKLNVEYESLASDNWSATFTEWLINRCKNVLQTHKPLMQVLPSAEKAQLRPLIVLATLHERLLELFISNPANFQQRAELGTLKKTWDAWKAARNF